MILVDANLLVYAHVEDFEQHDTCRQWLDDQLVGTAKVGLPWESLIAYVRLVTNPSGVPGAAGNSGRDDAGAGLAGQTSGMDTGADRASR